MEACWWRAGRYARPSTPAALVNDSRGDHRYRTVTRRNGKVAYVADAGTNEVTAFTIAATTGDLTAIAGDFAWMRQM